MTFEWKCCPEAAKLAEEAVSRVPGSEKLTGELLHKTSSRLFDWVDYVTYDDKRAIEATGFLLMRDNIYRHPGAQLPLLVVDSKPALGVSVDPVSDGLSYREKQIGEAIWEVERRSFDPPFTFDPTAATLWAKRPRGLSLDVAQKMVELVGEAVAASLVLEHERAYWQSRNRAGQVQYRRQSPMGWGNHDHHTFRSSRQNFHHLVHLFEILGFRCRERYYTGKEAGWGAQVMEHPKVRLVLFLDVDLLPDELSIDFAHQPLPETSTLGTIGLWCALHGDSIAEAGMHHLEAQFLFDPLTKDLAALGIEMMEPFSNFSYLKQAFTRGEMWPVDPSRLEKLLKAGLITPEQHKQFLTHGAIGSHLENLQRREGYKGFNQKNVSFIIKKTDPRDQPFY